MISYSHHFLWYCYGGGVHILLCSCLFSVELNWKKVCVVHPCSKTHLDCVLDLLPSETDLYTLWESRLIIAPMKLESFVLDLFNWPLSYLLSKGKILLVTRTVYTKILNLIFTTCSSTFALQPQNQPTGMFLINYLLFIFIDHAC